MEDLVSSALVEEPNLKFAALCFREEACFEKPDWLTSYFPGPFEKKVCDVKMRGVSNLYIFHLTGAWEVFAAGVRLVLAIFPPKPIDAELIFLEFTCLAKLDDMDALLSPVVSFLSWIEDSGCFIDGGYVADP